MRPDVIISVEENTDVASARRTALRMAADAGLGEEYAGPLGVVVTEVATNLIKHGGGGDVILSDLDGSLQILAIDKGPGMTNIPRCFTDGYSTAGSAGTGLGAVSRLSRFHDIYSAVEKGTVLMARVGPRAPAKNGGPETGAIGIPYPGETLSGDDWSVALLPAGRSRFIMADGLGHGLLAAQASKAAVESATGLGSLDPVEVIEKAHLRLRSTRGAAIAVVDVDYAGGNVTFAGVGNVVGAIVFSEKPRRQMISMNGTLGHEVRKPQQYKYPIEPDSLIVLHSDGLSASWAFEKYAGLFQRHPVVIAGLLFRDFRRTRDDATVVVVRAQEPEAAR